MTNLIRKTTTWALALLFALYSVVVPLRLNVQAQTIPDLELNVPNQLEKHGGGVNFDYINTWTLAKTASPSSFNVVYGGVSGTVMYTVTATKTTGMFFTIVFNVEIEQKNVLHTDPVLFKLEAEFSDPNGTVMFPRQLIESNGSVTNGVVFDHLYTKTFSISNNSNPSQFTPLKIEVFMIPVDTTLPQVNKSAAVTFKADPNDIKNEDLIVNDNEYDVDTSLTYDWIFTTTGTRTYTKTFPAGNVGSRTETNTVTGNGNDGFGPVSAQADVVINTTKAHGPTISVTSYDAPYDAAFHSIDVTNEQPGDTLWYSLTDGSGWETSLPTFKDVTGSTTVYVKITNDNYFDRYPQGTVRITQKSITVTADNKSKVFGAVDPGLTYSSTGLLGTDTFTGGLVRVAGENIGHYAINQGSLSAGSNYLIAFVQGDFVISQKSVTVTATDKSKVFGSIDPALTYSSSEDIPFTGALDRVAGENVGDYAINQGSLSAGSNYIINFVSGDFEITKYGVTVTVTAGQGKVFGSADPTAFAYTSTGLLGTDVFTGALDRIAGENVGDYAINQGSLSAGDNYAITFISDDFAITPAEGAALNITSYSGAYDGFAHSITLNLNPPENPAFFSLAIIIPQGDNVFYSLTNDGFDWSTTLPTFTNVMAETTVFVKVTNPNYLDRTGSGTVEITVREITLTVNSNSKVYDGLALSDSGYALALGSLATGEAFGGVTVIGSQTIVGSSDNVASAAIILDGEDDVTANYDITYINGLLTVTPATGALLDITDYNEVYDSADHSILVTNDILGDTIYYSLTNNGTDWSTSNPMYKNAMAETTVFVKVTNPNYLDRTGSGTVEITARAISITADSNSKVYDGLALSDSGYALTLGSLATGEVIDGVNVIGSQTIVGSNDNVASAAIIMDGLDDVTANYDITYVNGLLSVIPATGALLDITGFSVVYDAVAHSILVNNTILGDIVYFSLTNNGIDWSSTLPTFTNVTAVTTVFVKVTNPNYLDRTGNGSVEITARAISITADSNSKVFDGLALTDSGYSLSLGTLVLGESISAVTIIGSQTAIGSSANVASAAIIMNGLDNVSANYIITYGSGTLNVTAPTNVAPTATGATYTILRGTAISRLLARFDADGDALTFEIVAQPTRGSLTVNGAGRFNYVHDGIALTSDTFTYRVFDGALNSPIRTIRINFTDLPVENTAPVIEDASFETPFNTPLDEDVAPFGTDADGDPLTFILVTQPAHGTVTLSPSGSFHYVPNEIYSGVDSFTFMANDGVDDSNVATITINVTEEITIIPEPTPQAQMPWWWLLALLPFLLFLIRRPRPEVQEVVLNPDGTITTTWGYLGPRFMHKDYERDESILEVVSGDVKVVPPVETVPYEFDRGRHVNIFKTVSDKNAVIRWTIKKKAEELDKELIEKMLEKNSK